MVLRTAGYHQLFLGLVISFMMGIGRVVKTAAGFGRIIQGIGYISLRLGTYLR